MGLGGVWFTRPRLEVACRGSEKPVEVPRQVVSGSRVPANYFDEPVAATYDDLSARMFAPEVLDPTLDVLAELAGRGAALELAVGTGRVALALADRGVRVHGIELSPAMLQRLRAKPGGEGRTTSEGDMTSASVEGRFALVYLVFNTISNVTTQDGQVAVFANAAAHLEPGGHFVIEVGVPQLQSVPRGERFHVFERTEDYLGVDEYDVVTQEMWSHHHDFDGCRGPPRLDPVPLHLAERARPDGPPGRDVPRAPLGGLGPLPLHRREHLPRVGLAPRPLTGQHALVCSVHRPEGGAGDAGCGVPRDEALGRELPDPVPGPGQVLLEVVRGGICGSDLHARKHADEVADLASAIGYDDVMRPHQRVVMGHEFSGRVARLRAGHRKAWASGHGGRVAADDPDGRAGADDGPLGPAPGRTPSACSSRSRSRWRSPTG